MKVTTLHMPVRVCISKDTVCISILGGLLFLILSSNIVVVQIIVVIQYSFIIINAGI